jgi:K+-sensing histidine kinase KdpD
MDLLIKNRYMSTPTTTSSTIVGDSQQTKISKVLVAIDGSDASMCAADHAISISKKYNAELYALHVIRTDVELFGPHETYLVRMNIRISSNLFIQCINNTL